MRYLSVCSGIEAASVAWEPLGFEPVAFSEIEPFPSRVLAHRWPDVPSLGDFTTIDVEWLKAARGPVDLLVGGTPCQSFSVAGKRGSLADARGNLTLAYAELMHELARSHGLRWAVWENVPGVLNTPDNAFGCFLAALVGGDAPVVPPGARGWGARAHFDAERYDVHRTFGWESCGFPGQGMVSGPRARAAWRVLDAQYFGLAQRRERVFVVVGLGERADPAAVLFEPQGLRRHPPARGEAGQGVASPLAAGSPRGSGSRNDADTADNLIAATLDASFGRLQECSGQDANHGHSHLVPLAFGGNDTRGPIDVSTALNAHGGPHGRQDFESETFVVAHSLRGEGFDASEDGTGLGTPIVPVRAPIAFDCKAGGDTGFSVGPIAGALRGAGHGGGHAAIAFDTTQITSATNRSNPQPGDPCHPLSAGAHPPTIAFGISSDALDRSGEGTAGTAGARSGLGIEIELSQTLKAKGPNAVATDWAVRRLTPVECSRLMGFPDDYCAIPGAADGPIYKALGNSKAVPVVRWIGARIAAVDRAAPASPFRENGR